MTRKTVDPLPVAPAVCPDANGLPTTLEHGDHLRRPEFERRYDAMPNLTKAELIEGTVVVGSPVRHRRHGRPHNHLGGWLFVYEAATPGVESGGNSSLRLDLDNEPQPDCLLMIQPECGGQAVIDADDYVAAAPDWIGEISASTVSYDLHAKLQVYRRAGVREYVVWRVLDRAVDWFVLREGVFQPHSAAADGIHRSTVFPGLWLDAAALVAGDVERVVAVVRMGVATGEHAAFVAELAARRK